LTLVDNLPSKKKKKWLGSAGRWLHSSPQALLARGTKSERSAPRQLPRIQTQSSQQTSTETFLLPIFVFYSFFFKHTA
jgi:hypothetical protein